MNIKYSCSSTGLSMTYIDKHLTYHIFQRPVMAYPIEKKVDKNARLDHVPVR
jgi:hypothetical protein